MKKITLSAITIITSIVSIQAQLYTPPGTILGNSLNSNIGIGTNSPAEKITIQGNHQDSRFLLHSIGGSDDTRQADLLLWASEPGLTWSGVGIGNNVHNNHNLGGISLLNPARGGSYIRLLDNAMLFNVVSSSGTNNEAFSISPEGNIGIGITNPFNKLTVSGSITLDSGLTNASVRPLVSSKTLLNGEINGYGSSNPLADDGFLRLSAGGGTNNIRSYIDLSGYSTQPDMYGNIVMGTWGTERMRINSDGNIGIGTTKPETLLNIQAGPGGSNGVPALRIGGLNNYSSLEFGIDGDYDGMIRSYGNNINYYAGHWKTKGKIATENHSHNWHTSKEGSADWSTIKMILNQDGNLGIGTSNPDEKLSVNGKIHAKEVKIDLNFPAPDYVFANTYKLKSLQEVEEFIKQNSHLPEIPSAKEIEKNGLMLAEMNMSLLKKIEELTLYTIEQEKKNIEQSKEIDKANKEIETLKKENEGFKSLSERLSKIENQLK